MLYSVSSTTLLPNIRGGRSTLFVASFAQCFMIQRTQSKTSMSMVFKNIMLSRKNHDNLHDVFSFRNSIQSYGKNVNLNSFYIPKIHYLYFESYPYISHLKKNIATGETSPAITPFHFLDTLNSHHQITFITGSLSSLDNFHHQITFNTW